VRDVWLHVEVWFASKSPSPFMQRISETVHCTGCGVDILSSYVSCMSGHCCIAYIELMSEWVEHAGW